MTDTIIAALITGGAGLLTTVAAALFGIARNRSTKSKLAAISRKNAYVELLEPGHDFSHIARNVKSISLYTVNSHEFLNRVNLFLEQDRQATISKLTILVRRKEFESDTDLLLLNNNIAQWKNWLEKKRIKKLLIIGYNYDPDHYYAILGDRMVITGQVLFDDTKPTGTTVNYLPLVFSDGSAAGKQVIASYRDHFNNVTNYFQEEHTLFDSSKLQD